MNTLYGYMSSDELMMERENMMIENEMAHLFESYYMVEREHELNMKDIELKAILMEGCTIDDLQIMYEEEEQKTEEKKQGILSAIWERICNIFRAIIGKFDTRNIKLSDAEKEEKIETPDLDKLEALSSQSKESLDATKAIIDSPTPKDATIKAATILISGVITGVTIKTISDIAHIPQKVEEFLKTKKLFTKVAAQEKSNKILENTNTCISSAQEIADKTKTISTNDKGKNTSNNDDNKSDDNENKEPEDKGTLLNKMANMIVECFNKLRTAVQEVFSKLKGDKKEKENGSEDGQEPKKDENGSDGKPEGNDESDSNNNEKVEKSKKAQEGKFDKKSLKDLKSYRGKVAQKMNALGIEKSKGDKYSFDDLSKFVSKEDEELGKLIKDEDDNKRNKLAELFAAAKRIKEISDSKNMGNQEFHESTDEVDTIYTSLFESLDDIEHIDSVMENSNSVFNNMNNLHDLFDDIIM